MGANVGTRDLGAKDDALCMREASSLGKQHGAEPVLTTLCKYRSSHPIHKMVKVSWAEGARRKPKQERGSSLLLTCPVWTMTRVRSARRGA